MEKTEDVRREIEATRAKMAATAAEIESRIQGRIDAVKQKVDVADHARSHPWPALIAAVVVGAALGATGSDRKVVAAATRAVKQAPRVTTRAVKATATGAVHLAGAAVGKLRGGHDHDSDDGVFGRMRARFAAQARELGEHLGRAADDLLRSTGGQRPSTDASLRTDRTSASMPTERTDASMPTDRYAADAAMGYSTAHQATSAD